MCHKRTKGLCLRCVGKNLKKLQALPRLTLPDIKSPALKISMIRSGA